MLRFFEEYAEQNDDYSWDTLAVFIVFVKPSGSHEVDHVHSYYCDNVCCTDLYYCDSV